MTPGQFQVRVKKGTVPPAVLLLGPEAYERRRIKDALLATVPADAVTQHDLAELTLAEILDDARALSLFSSERLIWIVNAELALPRGRGAAADDGEGESAGAPGGGDAAPLTAYLKDPTPGVTLVFEAIRHDFEGEDKRKQDRVRKFYSAIPDVVELQKYTPQAARNEAESLIRRAGFRMEPDALDLLIDSLGAEIARIAVEIEKLSLFGGDRVIGVEDIAALVPDARATTIFALVNALGRRDRARALGILDTLTKEGEYLPLALAFLSTQFRMALVAREAGLKSSQQIQGHFSRLGVAMWGSRAEQVYQTVSKFNKPQMKRALGLIYKADKGLRDARPDDRIVMETFIMELVSQAG
jgi:DNA polymerase III subunit delta